MKVLKTIFFTLSLGIFLVSCQNSETVTAKAEGIDLNMMDTTVSPQEDFYRFVNGNWLSETEIPGDQGSWGSFNELRKKHKAAFTRDDCWPRFCT